MAAAGFMFGVVRGDMSAGSLLGILVFLGLGAFMFMGVFNMSRVWDEEKPAGQ